MYIYVYVYMYMYICICIYVYVYICICIYMHGYYFMVMRAIMFLYADFDMAVHLAAACTPDVRNKWNLRAHVLKPDYLLPT